MKLKYDFVIEEVAGRKVAMIVGEDTEKSGFLQLNDAGVYILNLLKTDISKETIIANIQKDFDVDDIYKLIAMQLDDNAEWDIISYRMGGEGDMKGTASMGWDRLLYVVHPFKSQCDFIYDEIEKMMNNERITQQVLPQEEDTTYIPN